MKKNLFVIESLNCGGAEKSLVTLLNNLNYSIYKVDLILTTKWGDFEKFLPSQVNVIYKNIYSTVNGNKLFVLRFKYWLLRKLDFKKRFHLSQHFWKVFGKYIAKDVTPYDVAIAYGQDFPTYYVAKKANSSYKYSWLNTDHQKTGYHAFFDYKFYNTFNKIIAVSNESCLSLQKAMTSINKTLSIDIIRDISDKDFILKMSEENEGFENIKNDIETIILTVCRLEPVKGLNLAVEACDILIRKGINVKWYLIGDGHTYENIKNKIKDLSIEKELILLGSQINPYRFVKDCDIYVQTSFHEGYCLTVHEAKIFNKPVVVTNVASAPNLISHGEDGLIVDIDQDSIYEGVKSLLINESKRELFGRNLLSHETINEINKLEI